MSQTPLLPASAPFAREQIADLNRVISVTSAEQRAWLSGFLAGMQAANQPQAAAPAAPAVRKAPLTILFGTESGNAEAVAAQRQGGDRRERSESVLAHGKVLGWARSCIGGRRSRSGRFRWSGDAAPLIGHGVVSGGIRDGSGSGSGLVVGKQSTEKQGGSTEEKGGRAWRFGRCPATLD